MNLFDKIGSFLDDVGMAIETGASNVIVGGVELGRNISSTGTKVVDKTLGEAGRAVESWIDSL